SVASSVAEINVGNPKELIAYTTDGLSIHLGDGDRVSERASVTEELLNEIAKKQLSIQYIDVNPDAPIVKEK
ncbi:MAG: cell division protein FtsQ/DivIB, partial [Megasphaera micronuciformis]